MKNATCLGNSLPLRIENVGTVNMSAPQSWYAFGNGAMFAQSISYDDSLDFEKRPVHGSSFLLELFDTAGKQQRQWKFNGEQFTLQRGDLPNGMYNYVVKMADGKIVGSGSVVVQ